MLKIMPLLHTALHSEDLLNVISPDDPKIFAMTKMTLTNCRKISFCNSQLQFDTLWYFFEVTMLFFVIGSIHKWRLRLRGGGSMEGLWKQTYTKKYHLYEELHLMEEGGLTHGKMRTSFSNAPIRFLVSQSGFLCHWKWDFWCRQKLTLCNSIDKLLWTFIDVLTIDSSPLKLMI